MNAPASHSLPAIAIPERMLTFGLGGEHFAIDAQCVREIMEVPAITRVPGAPAFADGLLNVRGAIVPLADLAIVFGMERAAHNADTRIIVIEAAVEEEAATIGILADKVFDVASLDGAPVESPPQVGMKWRTDFIIGIARHAGRFVILPDLPRIFTECVGQIHRAAPHLPA
ncbi:MAG TPA: chemotaxis protein CheW [Novosphingobium sp.]|nr:chemotaxis protein CheW [Novosphingobium sp.]HZV08734.1 chemotaxis protein CheW [Novosphingobium sp.]